MVDIFTNNSSRDEELASKAHPYGDIDLVVSPVDGALVVVAMIHGAHVCARCCPSSGPVSEEMLFVNDPAHRQRPVEWNPPNGQGTRVMLHAGCIGPAKKQGGQLIIDLVRGHQAKRFATRAMKTIDGIFKR
jgi:hypothetical protein